MLLADVVAVSEVYKRKLALQKKLKEIDSLDLAANPSNPASSPVAEAFSYLGENSSQLHKRRPLITRTSEDTRAQKTDYVRVADAIASGRPLDSQQVGAFERIVKQEVQALDEELKGKCTNGSNVYPKNLNVFDFFGYIPLPTVVYELEYPRQETINWYYVAEKALATFGVIGVMVVVSEAYIYPTVIRAVEMKDAGMPLYDRMME